MNKPIYQTFFLSITDSDRYNWESGNTGADNMIGVGIEVPAGETREIPTQLDYDAKYELHGIALEAYYFDRSIGAGIYRWYEPNPAGHYLEGGDIETLYGTPLVRSLRVTCEVLAPHNVYLFGSQDRNQLQTGDEFQLSPGAIQGYSNGVQPVREGRHIIEAGGLLRLTIENTHSVKDLIVAGTYHGRKIRVGV